MIRAVSQQKATAKRPGTQEKPGKCFGFRRSSSTRYCFVRERNFGLAERDQSSAHLLIV